MKETFYITTPIYYPSGKLHIGHAYTTIAGDVMSRYKKQKGFDTFYLTGTDEHGEKIEKKALANNVKPQQFVDEAAEQIKQLWKSLDIEYDKFIRTTDKDHEQAIQKIFDKLLENDDIYKDTYEGLYCVSCETYVTESSAIEGKKCPDCGADLKVIEEESYFFRCSKYVDRLMKHMEENDDFVVPTKRKNELINSFIKPGLQDLAVSRTSFKWGVPVKGDDKHVIYVWIDALSNYITALGYNSEDDKLFHKYWPANIHLIGKEIIRFHVIYWPMILMALDLPLPKQIFAHGWLLMDKDKMSKSKGNVIYPDYLIENYGVDTIRYYLMREVPFGDDGQFTPETYVNRINNDLANDLGNLLNRTINMANKYFDGKVMNKNLDFEERNLLRETLAESVSVFDKEMDNLNFSRALEALWKAISFTNKYVDLTKPWELAKEKEQSDKLMQVLFDLLSSLEKIGCMLNPFMPNTVKIMYKQINVSTEVKWIDDVSHETYEVTEVPKPIYPRLDVKEEVEKIQLEMERNAEQAKEKIEEEETNEITIDTFDKVQMQVVEVLEASKHKNANKLLVVKVSNGKEQKQIVSGLAQYYSPEELVGKKILIVSNLKEITLRGEKSQGMILTSESNDEVQVIEMPNASIGAVIK